MPNISKKAFIDSLKAAVIADEMSQVSNITYKKKEHDEIITITYTGGHTQDINVTANSNGTNMLEIAREVYGTGAFGRILKW